MRLLFFWAFVAISGQLSAQSIFRPLPKLQHTSAGRFGISTADSTFTGFRPVVSAAVFAYDKHASALMTGAGLSYEKDTYTASTGKWFTVWSIGLLAYAGGSLAPTDPSTVAAIGPNISFYNKLFSAGVVYNITTGVWMPTIGFSVSLNN